MSQDDFLEWEERKASEISLFKHCVAGSIAGIMEHLVFYPIDTLKTHMHAAEGVNSYLSLKRTAKILYQHEGLFRFWKGANIVASGCIPAHAS